jgi:hypothetical protein
MPRTLLLLALIGALLAAAQGRVLLQAPDAAAQPADGSATAAEQAPPPPQQQQQQQQQAPATSNTTTLVAQITQGLSNASAAATTLQNEADRNATMALQQARQRAAARQPQPGGNGTDILAAEPGAANNATVGAEASPSPAPPPCDDVQPTGSQYSCAEQAGFGKCSAPWMIEGGFCRRTCGAGPSCAGKLASSLNATAALVEATYGSGGAREAGARPPSNSTGAEQPQQQPGAGQAAAVQQQPAQQPGAEAAQQPAQQQPAQEPAAAAPQQPVQMGPANATAAP